MCARRPLHNVSLNETSTIPPRPASGMKAKRFQRLRQRIGTGSHGTRLATKPQRHRAVCLCGTTSVENMLRDALVLGYATTVGFVASGIIASFYKWITSEPVRFALLGEGTFALVTSFFFFALTGPVIIVEQVFRARLGREGPVSLLFFGFFIATLWSCCSGILVLSLVLSLKHFTV
jgi:cytochrome c biogenesis protein CcdA